MTDNTEDPLRVAVGSVISTLEGGIGYYILDGKTPVPVRCPLEWGRRFETANRHVALDQFHDATVSTVFLGIDHSFGGGPPLLFETMIFGGPHSDFQERYTSWDEAEEGHMRAVGKVTSEPPKLCPKRDDQG
jgi:hypothetical protein